jgi:hypothetical protein
LKRQHAALLPSAQMLDADQLKVVTGISEIRLMENRQAPGGARRHGTLKPRLILVLCGPGNNSGDGFVTARRLTEVGWPVRVTLPTAARSHGSIYSGAAPHFFLPEPGLSNKRIRSRLRAICPYSLGVSARRPNLRGYAVTSMYSTWLDGAGKATPSSRMPSR